MAVRDTERSRRIVSVFNLGEAIQARLDRFQLLQTIDRKPVRILETVASDLERLQPSQSAEIQRADVIAAVGSDDKLGHIGAHAVPIAAVMNGFGQLSDLGVFAFFGFSMLFALFGLFVLSQFSQFSQLSQLF